MELVLYRSFNQWIDGQFKRYNYVDTMAIDLWVFILIRDSFLFSLINRARQMVNVN